MTVSSFKLKYLHFDWNFTRFIPEVPIEKVIIVSINGLTPNSLQALSWISVDQDHQCPTVSLGYNELTIMVLKTDNSRQTRPIPDALALCITRASNLFYIANNMVADALAPCVTRASAAILLATQNRLVLLFPLGRISTTCDISVLIMMNNANIYLYFL